MAKSLFSAQWLIALTGANSILGIGRATAHQYAQNGARAVYICDFDDTYLAAHQREIKSLYPDVDVHVRQFDAADEKAVEEVIDDALTRYGRLDIFFANAGIIGANALFSDIEAGSFMQTMRVNALGCVPSISHSCGALVGSRQSIDPSLRLSTPRQL